MQFMIVASRQSNVPDATEVAMRPVEGGNPQCRTEPLAAILSANPRTATMQSALPRRRSVASHSGVGNLYHRYRHRVHWARGRDADHSGAYNDHRGGAPRRDNYGPAEIGTDI